MSQSDSDVSTDHAQPDTDHHVTHAEGYTYPEGTFHPEHHWAYDYDPADPDCEDGIPYHLDHGAKALYDTDRCPTVGDSDTLLEAGSLAPFYGSLPVVMKVFRNRLGIRASFVPVAARRYNQLRILYQLGEYVADLPPTRKYVRRGHLANHLPVFNTERSPVGSHLGHRNASSAVLKPMLLLHGLYPVDNGETAAEDTHYANPQYVHAHTYPTVTGPGERDEWLEQYARLGLVPIGQVAQHLGAADMQELGDIIDRAGVDWHAQRERGLRIMGRTLATNLAWGYDPDVLATAFGTTAAAVKHAARDVALRGFQPPSRDPSIPPTMAREFDHADVDPTRDEPASIEYRLRKEAPMNTTR